MAAARVRPETVRPLERLRERIATGDRGWFFAAIAEKVSERRAEIAARLEAAADGAAVLIVQGGINDVVQNRPAEQAAANLAAMVEHGRRLGLRVALVDVLPWNNGDDRAANDIAHLNTLVAAIATDLSVPLLPFHHTLADPERPHRMRDEWTDDGDHPSVEGHR